MTLIGPAASPIVEGRQFFQGPMIYYSLMVMMLLTNWSPIGGSIIMVLLSLTGAFFWYLTVKRWFGEKTALTTIIILTFWPAAIRLSIFLWNPNMFLLLVPLYSYFLTRAIKDKKMGWWIAAGMIGGISLQFHFQMVPILGLSLIGLFCLKTEWKKLIIWIAGITAGYSPLLLFDLRNNFYNIKTIWLWVSKGGDGGFNFQIYYLAAFFPLISLAAALIINKIKRNSISILLAVVWCLWGTGVAVTENRALGMTPGWSYPLEKQIVEKILEGGCPKDFNVASTISGDTRAEDLRYLLTSKACEPMEVNRYPEAKRLFLVAPSQRPAEVESIWEVKSLGEFRINNKIEYNKQVVFYELIKK